MAFATCGPVVASFTKPQCASKSLDISPVNHSSQPLLPSTCPKYVFVYHCASAIAWILDKLNATCGFAEPSSTKSSKRAAPVVCAAKPAAESERTVNVAAALTASAAAFALFFAEPSLAYKVSFYMSQKALTVFVALTLLFLYIFLFSI